MNRELLNLFNVYVDNEEIEYVNNDLLGKGIAVFDDNGIVKSIPKSTYKYIKERYGVTNDLFKHTFHKSLEKVRDTSVEDLVSEQIMHYFFTYGLEAMGFTAIPYIPVEKLELDLDEKCNIKAIKVVRVVSEEEAKQIIANYMYTVKAPNKENIFDIRKLISADLDINKIVSNEIKIMYYDKMGTAPKDGCDFLRYICYRATGFPLLIKNKSVIDCIKLRGDAELVNKADKIELAKIFFRFKPLILALKTDKTAATINKIRRLANKYHQPLPDVNIQNLNNLALQERWDDVYKVINNMDVRSLVKVINFTYCNNGIYNIRNGKVFVNMEHESKDSRLKVGLMLQLKSLITDKLKGKKYYIPDYICYKVPATEKQFINGIPYGSYIKFENNCSIGICWNNNGERVDYDLHLTSVNGNYGWNSSYKDDNIIYSGDMTDAKNGAAETYFIKENNEVLVVDTRLFCGPDKTPYKLIISDKKCERGAPLDVKDAILPAINLTDDGVLGAISNNKFYFYSGKLGDSIIPDREMNAELSKRIIDKLDNMIDLKTLLQLSGAEVVNEMSDDCIDLSPNSLAVDTIMNIINEYDA